ncbi:Putative HTH-type transcriptional regulator (modular protein) [Acidobacteriia bacterium SbA2]|nr:Putative HTH-type transcriptional regulator (modular protein) [Acidobacteriia bacterium SbA2]
MALNETRGVTWFAGRLRELRNARGLSQNALAERAELDHTYISRLEKGRINPTVVVLERLARGLEVGLDKLLHGAAEMPEAPKPPRLAPAQYQERLLLRAFREMPRKDRSLLVFMARKLVSDAPKTGEERRASRSSQEPNSQCDPSTPRLT